MSPSLVQQAILAAKTTAKVFYKAMVKRIELPVRIAEAYDTKTAAWFALSTLIISISATALAAEHTLLKKASIVLALTGTAFWLLAIIASLLCFHQSDLDVGPTEEDYSALAADPAFSATEMHMFIAAFIAAQSIPKNQRLLKGKARSGSHSLLGYQWESLSATRPPYSSRSNASGPSTAWRSS